MKQAPRVISRVGSMQNLVDHVLQPTVANYFRNSAQQVTVLEFLSDRTRRQQEAFSSIQAATGAYDVECIDTLIGDIQPPAELMKTQTDRKIAEELQRTFDVQKEAQVQRQLLERETSIANMQGDVVRSEQMVRISEKNALAAAEVAKGEASRTKIQGEAEAVRLRYQAESEANAVRLSAEARAVATRLQGNAEAEVLRTVGAARANAFKDGAEAMGSEAFTLVQVATVLGENRVKLVPDIAVGSGDGAGSLASAYLGKLLESTNDVPAAKPAEGVPRGDVLAK
jgi:uncharacterized membrane protein YqiK